ncbi:MAG TPA: DUF1849 family protein [Alphaproteobacteria bacterium]|nr:DUF1849 family protein [Alphaproteobacteria bacterium]
MRQVLLIVLGFVGLAAAAQAAVLQPHRAVYDLDLQANTSAAEGMDATGRVVVELSQTCEAWLLNERMLTRVYDPDGEAKLSDYRLAAWESRDGRRYRFTTQNFTDGRLVDEQNGTARLGMPGKAGEISYDKPKPGAEPLPAGAVFPVTQSRLLLQSALSGAPRRTDLLFDGSGDGAYSTISVLGRRRALPPGLARRWPRLKGMAAWPVQVSYYRPGDETGVPDFEIAFDLLENGISSTVTMDYGRLRFAGHLIDLTYLSVPDCQ